MTFKPPWKDSRPFRENRPLMPLLSWTVFIKESPLITRLRQLPRRPISSLIEGAGFHFERLKTSYMPGPKPMTFMYEGSAQ